MGAGYYPDFATGIIVGILLGVFACAVICAMLFVQVSRLTARVRAQDTIVEAFRIHTPVEAP